MFGDDSSSWLDDIGGVLGITPPPPQTAEPVFDGGMSDLDVPAPTKPSGQGSGNWFDSVTEAVSDAVSGVQETVKKAAEGVAGGDGSGSAGGSNPSGGAPSGGGGAGSSSPSSVFESVKEAMSGAAETVKKAAANAAQMAGGATQVETEEPGWFDQVKDYVSEKVESASEWLKDDEDESGEEEKGVLESIWDIFDGDNEEEGDEVDETEKGEEADEKNAVFGDQPEDDPWWGAMLAVDQRAQTLQMQMNSLHLGSKPEETPGGKFLDPQKQALYDEIVAFNSECADIRGSWDQLEEGYRADVVLDLEYKADMLEGEIKPYMGAIEDYDAKLAEKLAIIARAIQPIQNQVLTQEAIVKYDKQKVESIKQSLDNQKLVAQVNVGLGLLNVALGSFPPTAIIATGMTLLQMGMQPSESGAVELSSEVAGCLTKSMKFTSKLAGGLGALANVTGLIDQCKEDRDQYVKIYKNLQTAINRLNSSSQSLNGLMQQFNTQLSKAQQYASKATGT